MYGFEGKNGILINRLYRERFLFLGQEVDSEISNQLISLMIYLSIEKENKDLYLFINSPGGWVISGIAIYDIMQFVQPDVQTVCLGLAASMGFFLLAGGTITKLLAFPHAWRQLFFSLIIYRIDIYLSHYINLTYSLSFFFFLLVVCFFFLTLV